MQFQIFDPGLD